MAPGMIKLMLPRAQREVYILHWNRALIYLGIKVANTPGVVAAATADLGIFLLLGSIRNLNSGIFELRRGTI
jgi:phosphoglycerate dehydrogenase-like enzyme